MSKKLSATNPYLRDPAIRKESLWVAAKTSSVVEGIRRPFSKAASRKVSRSRATSQATVKRGKP
jgi:hypothetical protein